ncbi:hypothetical protein BBJ28_00021951 [Nothophytophthora sp. Chile5]|nr:hypothetical protein BBJ28_00021951 [Nothophytophthora sp. Chile5]
MTANSATEAADGAASAPLELSTLCPDALQDSYAAVYSILVVAPLTALASRWLLSRGKRTTPTQVLLLSLLVPALLIGIPAMSRLETGYVWAQKYAYLRHQFQEGAMPLHVWQQIDSAYDVLFPFTTPREFVRWGHRLFPVFAFAAVSVKRTFFVDLDKHHQVVLRHMLEKNQVPFHKTMGTLKAIENALLPEEEAEESPEK